MPELTPHQQAELDMMPSRLILLVNQQREGEITYEEMIFAIDAITLEKHNMGVGRHPSECAWVPVSGKKAADKKAADKAAAPTA